MGWAIGSGTGFDSAKGERPIGNFRAKNVGLPIVNGEQSNASRFPIAHPWVVMVTSKRISSLFRLERLGAFHRTPLSRCSTE